MKDVVKEEIQQIYIPGADSHKGQNGRMLIIGGSHLFHAASLWSLTVASRIVDLVHYASVPSNNEIVQKAKEEFRNGIVITRNQIEEYIEEDDVILIGPGMVRTEKIKKIEGLDGKRGIEVLEHIEDEGVQTMLLTNYLLKKYPQKQWVIDAGALQMIDVSLIPKHAILTPHHGEFEMLWRKAEVGEKKEVEEEIEGEEKIGEKTEGLEERVKKFATTYTSIVLHKGKEDIVCNGETGEMRRICGGNAGMTKGGTGDVLAGLIAAIACKTDPFIATLAGSYINKAAGDALYDSVGPFFNASDLANEIPRIMKKIFVE